MYRLIILICWSLFFSAQVEAVSLHSEMASVERGAKFFSANCFSCHTLVYLRHDKVAQAAGIIDDHAVRQWSNGVVPPDLSLVAERRGVKWLNDYLHSFYQDINRPTGANNLLVPNTSMINILLPFQGERVLIEDKVSHVKSLKQVTSGSLTPAAFDATINDVVNFLDYAAQPYRDKQHKLGMVVLIFLGIFILLIYVLMKEYWKDVARYKKDNDHE